MMRIWTTGLSFPSLLLSVSVSLPAAAQSGYGLSTSSGSFASIRFSGTPLSLSGADDTYGAISAPFGFPFFGEQIPPGTSLYASSNGALHVGGPSASYSNTLVPTAGEPDGFIAPFWDDLKLSSTADVWWSAEGSLGGRTLVVEWADVSALSFQAETASFQARIHEGSGVIELAYGPRIGGAGWSGTIGVEDLLGARGLSAACGSACTLSDVPQGTILVFTPTGGASPPPPPPPPGGGGGTIQIVTPSLPEGRVGAPYQAQLTASGGVPPYAFQVIDGRPDWLLLASDGSFVGTPTAPGRFDLTVSVFDSQFNDAMAVLRLDVVEPGELLVQGALPAAVTGRVYHQPVVTGGLPPYTIQVASGALPGGLAFDALGNLAGTPVASGAFAFDLVVEDSDQPPSRAAASIDLAVTELLPLEVATRDLTVFTRTDVDLTLEASGGVPPYTWSQVEGTLLAGLTFDPGTARVAGRVDRVGTATVTFAVRDGEGSTAERPVLIHAKVFRTAGGGARGRPDRGGCRSAGAPSDRAVWLVLAVLLGIVSRRRPLAGSHTRTPVFAENFRSVAPPVNGG